LNKTASEICQLVGVNAVTDITGFGLLGHALEMAQAGKEEFVLNYQDIPVIPEAIDSVARGFVPGGAKANHLYTAPNVDYPPSLQREQHWLLNDPQTSGGLLISVSESKAERLRDRMTDAGIKSPVIGYVTAERAGKIIIR